MLSSRLGKAQTFLIPLPSLQHKHTPHPPFLCSPPSLSVVECFNESRAPNTISSSCFFLQKRLLSPFAYGVQGGRPLSLYLSRSLIKLFGPPKKMGSARRPVLLRTSPILGKEEVLTRGIFFYPCFDIFLTGMFVSLSTGR